MRDTVIRLRIVAHAFPLALMILAIITDCQSAHAYDGYASLKDRPLPKTPAERDSECAWIRSEQARTRSQADMGASTTEKYNLAMAQSMRAEATQIQAQLETRYTQIQCSLVPAAATQPVAPVPTQAATQLMVVPPAQAPTQPMAAPAVQAQAKPVIAPPVQAQAQPMVAAPAQGATQSMIPAASQAPAQPVIAPPCPGGLTFDQCFAKCRELTKRTAEQCFDTCRH